MKHLYAPWRGNYITESTHPRSCVFCEQIKTQHDAEHFILQRFTHCFVMLNLFPYNAGHLMVIPYRHVAMLSRLRPEERGELMEVSNHALVILKKTLKADGFNLGVNLGGKAAGGSIPHHLHMHVLPRWHGDTSFLTTLAETKQISVDLPDLYRTLKGPFSQLPRL